jgi:hypothetical protein
MNIRDIGIHAVTLVLAFTFVLLAVNKAVYVHSHKTADGQIITHAHPYHSSSGDPAPFEKHKHQKIDFLYFDNLDHVLLLLFFLVILLVLRTSKRRYGTHLSQIPIRSIRLQQGRAPPVS